MSVTYRRAVTSEAKPLIGFYSESGGGKTHGALLTACGFVGGDMSKVAMIETESGRGEAWADDPVVGGYNVIPLRGNFSPAEYGAAIAKAEAERAQALIIDSASHEWEGVGGVLDMAAKNQADGKKGVLVWQQPKIQHSREFMLRLMQSPIPLIIVCMRAKYPMQQVDEAYMNKWREERRSGNPPKMGDWVRSSALEPKQSDDILFEMFVHGWFDTKEHKFHGTKYTRESMKGVFQDGQVITVDTGKRLAQWSSAVRKPTGPSQTVGNPELITADQATALEVGCNENGIDPAKLKQAIAKHGGYTVERFAQIRAEHHERAEAWIAAVLENRKKAQTE